MAKIKFKLDETLYFIPIKYIKNNSCIPTNDLFAVEVKAGDIKEFEELIFVRETKLKFKVYRLVMSIKSFGKVFSYLDIDSEDKSNKFEPEIIEEQI